MLPSVVSETHRRSGTQEVAVSLTVAKEISVDAAQAAS